MTLGNLEKNHFNEKSPSLFNKKLHQGDNKKQALQLIDWIGLVAD